MVSSILGLAFILVSGTGGQQADRFLAQYPSAKFTDLYRASLDTFLEAEDAYKKNDYKAASALVESFWAKHPPGTDEWVGAYRDAAEVSRTTGIMIGHPPCYYGLRMLTECVRWRMKGGKVAPDATVATLSVVLVGKAHGTEPRSRAELDAKQGLKVEHLLQPLLSQDGNRVVHQSLWLFTEYMQAATRGRLRVRTDIVNLPNLDVPTQVSWAGRGFATLADQAWDPIWSSLPPKTRATTDWWWVLYPSAVPEQYPDFARSEFVTGGMGSGPDGLSPCFIIDDRWLTRRPPHLGHGTYTDVERRAYLPQWLQHEFFHHLFRIYPEFGLEKTGHAWFDRKTWPADFVGKMEPDYYDEAMQKRFLGSDPSLAVRLLYAPPDKALFGKLKAADVVGEYRHDPVENDWHVGALKPEPREKGKLRWTNKAGKSWLLTPDLVNGVLKTGPDCPYYDSNPTNGRAFTIVLQRGAGGRYLPKIAGYQFNGAFYRKL
jgi:hypothetical protein